MSSSDRQCCVPVALFLIDSATNASTAKSLKQIIELTCKEDVKVCAIGFVFIFLTLDLMVVVSH